MYERRRAGPKNGVWFKISKARERDGLEAVGNEDFGFGKKTVAGEHVDQVVAG